jgi:hypothetical protein
MYVLKPRPPLHSIITLPRPSQRREGIQTLFSRSPSAVAISLLESQFLTLLLFVYITVCIVIWGTAFSVYMSHRYAHFSVVYCCCGGAPGFTVALLRSLGRDFSKQANAPPQQHLATDALLQHVDTERLCQTSCDENSHYQIANLEKDLAQGGGLVIQSAFEPTINRRSLRSRPCPDKTPTRYPIETLSRRSNPSLSHSYATVNADPSWYELSLTFVWSEEDWHTFMSDGTAASLRDVYEDLGLVMTSSGVSAQSLRLSMTSSLPLQIL